MHERRTCNDCGVMAPETNTSHTLISSSFGWRVTRHMGRSGMFVMEWRCASCWKKHKAASTPAAPLPLRKSG